MFAIDNLKNSFIIPFVTQLPSFFAITIGSWKLMLMAKLRNNTNEKWRESALMLACQAN